MATVWSWSSSADTDPEVFVGTAPTVVSGGAYGERFVWPSTTAQAYGRKAVTSLGNHGIRMIYSLDAYATSSHMIAGGNDTASTFQWRLDLTAGGLLRLRDAALAQVDQGTVALPVATQHRFEIVRAGSVVTAKAYRVSDNSLRDTVTGTCGGTALSYVEFGNNASLTGTLGSFQIDEMTVTDTAAEVGPLSSPLSATATFSPSSSTAPFTGTLTISASGGTGSYTYQVLNWGDGTTSPSQSSPVFTKAIASGASVGLKTITYRVTG